MPPGAGGLPYGRSNGLHRQAGQAKGDSRKAFRMLAEPGGRIVGEGWVEEAHQDA